MSGMTTARRATIYLDPDVHRALRLRAAAADRTISDMVNEAVKQALAEDVQDLKAFDKRRGEQGVEFEEFVKALKRRGEL
jgi:plasmid stability protein